MSDIAKELADLNACDDRCRGRCDKCPNDTIREAVARIEQLEAALRAARPFVKDDGYSSAAQQVRALVDAALANSSIPTPETKA